MNSASHAVSNLSQWEGVIFDLDGTLVRLVVPWHEVDNEIASIFESKGYDIPENSRIWEFLHVANEAGFRAEVEDVLQNHEVRGAKISEALPLIQTVDQLNAPVAICSLNCEKSCRIALNTHEYYDAIDTFVGRDTVSTWKPDPEPLLTAIEGIGVPTASAVFVGDSPRDKQTAEAAKVDFQYVQDILS